MIISVFVLSIIVFIYFIVLRKIRANKKSGISKKSDVLLLAIIAYYGLPFLLILVGYSLTFLMSCDTWKDIHPNSVELKK